jgi:hypothetical protein
MGRDRHEKDRQQQRLPPFVPLLIDTLDQPAWRALSHGAQMLYVALKRRFNPKIVVGAICAGRCAGNERKSLVRHVVALVLDAHRSMERALRFSAPRENGRTADKNPPAGLCFCVSENRSDIARATSTPGWLYPPRVPRRNTASARPEPWTVVSQPGEGALPRIVF